ncbi:hypothetical protein EVAR_79740_1 [Eumeta japonica]|uniref:Uncharacterized protein n=1 Tax=Eumeta variegata TaxID=151549 RepID=A0A4C1T961_EUMVA|nr:hypothetical protein EVAR_79740_1 [Eumeta japonica]
MRAYQCNTKLTGRGGKKYITHTHPPVHANRVRLKLIKKVLLKKWRVGSAVSWNADPASSNTTGQHTRVPMARDMLYERFLRVSFRHRMSLDTDTGRVRLSYSARKWPSGVGWIGKYIPGPTDKMIGLRLLTGGCRAEERIGMRFRDVEEILRCVLHKFGYNREF